MNLGGLLSTQQARVALSPPAIDSCDSEAPAKRSQHANATLRVAMCCNMLGVVGFSNLSQQHPTCCNMVAKRSQHVAPNNVAIWGFTLLPCLVTSRVHIVSNYIMSSRFDEGAA